MNNSLFQSNLVYTLFSYSFWIVVCGKRSFSDKGRLVGERSEKQGIVAYCQDSCIVFELVANYFPCPTLATPRSNKTRPATFLSHEAILWFADYFLPSLHSNLPADCLLPLVGH